LGIRVTNDVFEAIALNGPGDQPYVCKGAAGGRRFNFSFHDAPETLERCADEIAAYVTTIGEPWFVLWREGSTLMDRADSPLSPEAKASLRQSMDLGPHPERVEQTRRLLGVA
jgi:hypothetical protein